jgi:hypothetical protein
MGPLPVWRTIRELAGRHFDFRQAGQLNQQARRLIGGKAETSRSYCQPGTPRISGRWCAMPLWQSMQVFSPGNRKRWCATDARGDCLVMSIDAALWQLRHSSESLALSRDHSCSASSPGAARLSIVSISTKSLVTGGATTFCGTWHEVQKKRRGDTEARNWPSRSMKWVTPRVLAIRRCGHGRGTTGIYCR